MFECHALVEKPLIYSCEALSPGELYRRRIVLARKHDRGRHGAAVPQPPTEPEQVLPHRIRFGERAGRTLTLGACVEHPIPVEDEGSNPGKAPVDIIDVGDQLATDPLEPLLDTKAHRAQPRRKVAKPAARNRDAAGRGRRSGNGGDM